jgi:hypothetical protein
MANFHNREPETKAADSGIRAGGDASDQIRDVLKMLGQIAGEAQGMQEGLGSLGASVWGAQIEAFKTATLAAVEYRAALIDLGASLDTVGGQLNQYTHALNILAKAQGRLIRRERELTREIAESTGAVTANSTDAGPQSQPAAPGEAKPAVKGWDLFGQAEAIVAGGSATPQQQQFLANLASIMSAHSLTYQQAIEYFKINEGNLQIVTSILEHHQTAIANFSARLDSLAH